MIAPMLRLERRSMEVPCMVKGLPGACWVTVRGRNTGGYSQISVQGRTMGAHRFAYEELRGEIPERLEPDHLCRNRACWNPWHLEIVTRSVNLRRSVRGPRPGRGTGRCPRGHVYDKVTRNGYPVCSLCSRLAGIAFRKRRKEQTRSN